MKKWLSLSMLGLLAACATQDMQGHDPREYYAKHPIVNKIDTGSKTVMVHFQPGANRLSPMEMQGLSDNLHSVSMLAVQTIHIGIARVDAKNETRKAHIKKMLRIIGYQKDNFVFEPMNAVSANDMQIDLKYEVVVSPDCPDWRTSPVTTHSNTHQGNFACASQVNLGLMVADPHDLTHGNETPGTMDTPTAAKSVQDFHEGKAANGASAGGSSSTGANSSMEGGSGAGASQ